MNANLSDIVPLLLTFRAAVDCSTRVARRAVWVPCRSLSPRFKDYRRVGSDGERSAKQRPMSWHQTHSLISLFKVLDCKTREHGERRASVAILMPAASRGVVGLQPMLAPSHYQKDAGLVSRCVEVLGFVLFDLWGSACQLQATGSIRRSSLSFAICSAA